MSHRYSPEEKQHILDRVRINRGNVARTAAEFGIDPATIYKWRKSAKFANSSSSFSSPMPPQPDSVGTGLALSADSKSLSVHGEGFREGLPPDDLQALRDLKSQMLREAEYISVNIRSAVDDAPLSQRVTALAQLIDRIIKLAAQLPADEEEVEIINYERGETDEEDTTAGENTWEATDYSE